MKKNSNLLLLAFLCLQSAMVSAKVLLAEGYGETKEAARIEALSTLASNIFVQIESNSESYASTNGDSRFISVTQSSSDLPLIGVQYEYYDAFDSIFCQATMNTELSSANYQLLIKQLVIDINQRIISAKDVDERRLHGYWLKTLSLYEEYEKNRTILIFLKGTSTSFPTPELSKALVVEKISALESSVASLKLAAQLLAKGIDHSSIYIKPALYQDFEQITPFSQALLAELKNELDFTPVVSNATAIFSGSYQLSSQGIKVSYSLISQSGKVLQTRLVDLSPKSYQGYETKPSSPDFDRLLREGYAVPSDFNVQVSTNKGQRQLLFNRGETIQILIKLNQSGYFFIVGHSKEESGGEELSYLLELNGGIGGRRFVYYINEDDANKWVSIGEFEVSPPFGLESLQVVATYADPVNALPDYQYDISSGYHQLVARDMTEAVVKVRALKMKVKKDSVKRSESVLMFTTSN